VRPRSQLGTAIALFSLATLVFTYGFASFLRVQPIADLDLHIEFARELRSLSNLTSPHFLFQLLLSGGHALGLSYETAAVWILGICYGGMAVLIGREIERRGIVIGLLRTTMLVMGVLLASHIFLLTVFNKNTYFGYFVPIAYHNPTQQLNKLFALWVYFVYRSQFLTGSVVSASSIPVLGGLCVLSALAKPSFLIAFLPTAAAYSLADIVKRRWRQALICAAAIGVPSALILAWQARIAYGGGTSVQVAFAPFVVFDATETLYKLPMSLAFPLVVGIIAWRARTGDVARERARGLRFIWILTALSLFATLGLVETGERMMQGNFAWTGQTATFLIFVESMLYLLTQPPGGGVRAAWIVFGVHVVCGFIWYGLMFSADRPAWL
jgi:hypothetical protein